MTQKRNLLTGATFLALLTALVVAQSALEQQAAAQAKSAVQAPMFEVDPFWPKPLPNHWILGMVIGAAVDAQDHVWILHRGSASMSDIERAAELQPPAGECCRAAPPVLEFDQAGNLVASWGGPGEGYEWPQSNHGLTIDGKGNIWIGGNGAVDGHVLQFTRAGKFLKQFGFQYANAGNNDTWAFGKVADHSVDDAKNEVYIADGESNGNTRRVVVVDADTGKFKRYWGAYGNRPSDDDPGPYDPSAPVSQVFSRAVHCVEMSRDGFVYVCDRENNRIQVFTPDGKFVKEQIIAKNTLGLGSPADIAFSRDPQQKYLYLTDGQNQKVFIMDRQSLQILTSFGDGGRQPGQFFSPHSIAVDSKGNIYETETLEGKRVQRFIYKGIGPVQKENQGVLWPRVSSR